MKICLSAAGKCDNVLKVPVDVSNEQLGAGKTRSVPEISTIVVCDMNRSLPSSALSLNLRSRNTFLHRKWKEKKLARALRS